MPGGGSVAGVAHAVAVRVGLIRVRCVGTVVRAVDDSVSIHVIIRHATAARARFGLGRVVRTSVIAVRGTVAVRVDIRYPAATGAGRDLAGIHCA